MRNWKNWRTRDPFDPTPDALGTDPLPSWIETFPGGGVYSDADGAWNSVVIEGDAADYIDPTLTGKANNFWKYLKWWRWGQVDKAPAPSRPGTPRCFMVDLGLMSKMQNTSGYRAMEEPLEGMRTMAEWAAWGEGRFEVGIFVEQFPFPSEGRVETRIRLEPRITWDFGSKIITILVDGQPYALTPGVVAGEKTLASTPYVSTYEIVWVN